MSLFVPYTETESTTATLSGSRHSSTEDKLHKKNKEAHVDWKGAALIYKVDIQHLSLVSYPNKLYIL